MFYLKIIFRSKEFFPEFIKDLFEKTAKIESYIQHFNSTNPIEKVILILIISCF